MILALEGGYDLPAICDASYECVRALLGDEGAAIRPDELSRRPCQNAVETLHKCIAIQVFGYLKCTNFDLKSNSYFLICQVTVLAGSKAICIFGGVVGI